ncbi:hypothetical protein J6590_001319 [Homalodisca vitripennis]|nr:hypothetical protein J6590_001319 [Homalodisca vitripennis]
MDESGNHFALNVLAVMTAAISSLYPRYCYLEDTIVNDDPKVRSQYRSFHIFYRNRPSALLFDSRVGQQSTPDIPLKHQGDKYIGPTR